MSRNRINFRQINQAALACLESLCLEWFPNGHREGREFKIGSLAGEKGRSLSVNLTTGVWHDFSSGEGGSDPISLLAAIRSISMGEAARELGARLRTVIVAHGVTAPNKPSKAGEWTPIAPVPENAPAPVFRHWKFGMPSRTWKYLNAEGKLVGHVCRFDLPDGGKEVLPRSYCKGRSGREWCWLSFSKPRPLYGLELLAANPDAGVVICEGEKATDAARRICPGVVVTWPGGSNAVRHADWQPLTGRRVVIWPDADPPGLVAAREITRLLRGIANTVRIVSLPEGLPEGFDAADAMAADWPPGMVWELLQRPDTAGIVTGKGNIQ